MLSVRTGHCGHTSTETERATENIEKKKKKILEHCNCICTHPINDLLKFFLHAFSDK